MADPAPDHAAETARLRLAQKIGQVGTFEWRIREGRVIWSPELEVLYGVAEGSGEGTFSAWIRRLVSEDANELLEAIRDCLARRQQNFTFEFRVLLPDRTRCWRLMRGQFFYGESGEPLRLLGMHIDIDSRKEAEAHLRHHAHTLDTALSYTPDFAYLFDLDGRFTYVNRALLALWNKSPDQAVGRNFVELGYPKDLAERLQHQIQQVIETGESVRDQTPYTAADGETGEYEYILVPVIASDGRVEAVAGSTRDITSRKLAEKALAASEENLQQVFEQAPVAIVVFRGRDFVVELANPKYRAFLRGEHLVGRSLRDIIPELSPSVWEVLYGVFDTGEPFIADEWLVPYDADLDGVLEDHWFNVVYHPLRAANGAVSGVVAVLSEVTAQVKSRREQEILNRRLEEFAYVASHDLQEPLRMVNIYTQLILRRVGGGDAILGQYADFVQRGVASMEALIADLLAYSRTIHDDGLPVGTADLSAALQEALALVSDRAREIGAVVNIDPLPVVRGETPQFAQVFQNLLSNALKYRRPEVTTEIQVSVRREENQWIICVGDNGIGFEPEYAERVFGLFKRLHKAQYPGTGLGLAICQRIIERYGGRMWAEGRPGEGASFYFAMPILEEN